MAATSGGCLKRVRRNSWRDHFYKGGIMNDKVIEFHRGKLQVASSIVQSLSLIHDGKSSSGHLREAFYAINRAEAALLEESPTKSPNSAILEIALVLHEFINDSEDFLPYQLKRYLPRIDAVLAQLQQ